jgi:transposase
MVMVNRYEIKRSDGRRMQIVSQETSKCPMCSGKLIVIGTRSRMVIDSGGTTLSITIRRLRCKECGKIHHELPDLVIPFKRHCADTIEKIIADNVEGIDCEEGTIRRVKAWWRASLPYFKGALRSLSEKYGDSFFMGAPKEIVRAVVNSHLWPHTRSAFSPG